MSRKPDTDRNNLILYLRDEEGRVFSWIKKYLEENGRGTISIKNITKIYHREKTKLALEAKKQVIAK